MNGSIPEEDDDFGDFEAAPPARPAPEALPLANGKEGSAGVAKLGGPLPLDFFEDGASANSQAAPLNALSEGRFDGSTAAYTFAKGDSAWYCQRDGSWIAAQVVSVDHSVHPPSFGILVGDVYRETELYRLHPVLPGQPAPPPQTKGSAAAATCSAVSVAASSASTACIAGSSPVDTTHPAAVAGPPNGSAPHPSVAAAPAGHAQQEGGWGAWAGQDAEDGLGEFGCAVFTPSHPPPAAAASPLSLPPPHPPPQCLPPTPPQQQQCQHTRYHTGTDAPLPSPHHCHQPLQLQQVSQQSAWPGAEQPPQSPLPHPTTAPPVTSDTYAAQQQLPALTDRRPTHTSIMAAPTSGDTPHWTDPSPAPSTRTATNPPAPAPSPGTSGLWTRWHQRRPAQQGSPRAAATDGGKGWGQPRTASLPPSPSRSYQPSSLANPRLPRAPSLPPSPKACAPPLLPPLLAALPSPRAQQPLQQAQRHPPFSSLPPVFHPGPPSSPPSGKPPQQHPSASLETEGSHCLLGAPPSPATDRFQAFLRTVVPSAAARMEAEQNGAAGGGGATPSPAAGGRHAAAFDPGSDEGPHKGTAAGKAGGGGGDDAASGEAGGGYSRSAPIPLDFFGEAPEGEEAGPPAAGPPNPLQQSDLSMPSTAPPATPAGQCNLPPLGGDYWEGDDFGEFVVAVPERPSLPVHPGQPPCAEHAVMAGLVGGGGEGGFLDTLSPASASPPALGEVQAHVAEVQGGGVDGVGATALSAVADRTVVAAPAALPPPAALHAVPSGVSISDTAVSSPPVTAPGGGEVREVVGEYAVAWARMLQYAASELERGQRLWDEALRLECSVQLLEHSHAQRYLAALGRVYLAAAAVQAGAGLLGMLSLVEELQQAWGRCQLAWEAPAPNLGTEGKAPLPPHLVSEVREEGSGGQRGLLPGGRLREGEGGGGGAEAGPHRCMSLRQAVMLCYAAQGSASGDLGTGHVGEPCSGAVAAASNPCAAAGPAVSLAGEALKGSVADVAPACDSAAPLLERQLAALSMVTERGAGDNPGMLQWWEEGCGLTLLPLSALQGELGVRSVPWLRGRHCLEVVACLWGGGVGEGVALDLE